MAIYISGVKGLPEQVQANKEDIEQIKEDIANIDFDAIRELETQVGENTQDINNLEASIGVQNQAINGLGDRVTTAEGKITQLESDTRKITYNATDDETRIQGTTRIANIKNNRIGEDDSIITFGTANGIELRQGTHIMNYDDQGNLYLDGIQVVAGGGGGVDLFQHNIILKYPNNFELALIIYTDSGTSFDYTSFKNYMSDNFSSNKLPVSGYVVVSGNYYNAYAITHTLPNSFQISYNTGTSAGIQGVNYGNPNYEVIDNVIAI